jgi:hypothetical protein
MRTHYAIVTREPTNVDLYHTRMSSCKRKVGRRLGKENYIYFKSRANVYIYQQSITLALLLERRKTKNKNIYIYIYICNVKMTWTVVSEILTSLQNILLQNKESSSSV